MISTRDLSGLPNLDGLRRTLQSMAMLDAILCPDWQYRYYSFNAAWSPQEQMGSMRNGSGDEFFAHFSPAGCWLKGFAHESLMSSYYKSPPRPWPGVLDAVPRAFSRCLEEPAFDVVTVSFCIWRQPMDREWHVGPVSFPPGSADPDGSEDLLSPLDGLAETYRAWAADYYERDVDLAAVEHVYRHSPLTSKVVARLNPELSVEDLASETHEIGYRVT